MKDENFAEIEEEIKCAIDNDQYAIDAMLPVEQALWIEYHNSVWGD